MSGQASGKRMACGRVPVIMKDEDHRIFEVAAMPSPFPGMDPYLENPAYWSDFHSRFINYWCEAIADALPPQYEATLGERVYLVEQNPDACKLGIPDVALVESNERPGEGTHQPASVATLDPITIPLTILEGPRETYIEILYQPDHSLVTALELLSPANKEQPGRTQYLEKRMALLYQQVHLVELDLLRGGRRMPTSKPLPVADYYYLLARAEQRPDGQVYSWTMRDALPRLPVPLRAPDADIFVDLAAVFNTAYDRARFGRRLQYRNSLPSGLSEQDQVWLQSILREVSLRQIES